jgi:hypothetical protein
MLTLQNKLISKQYYIYAGIEINIFGLKWSRIFEILQAPSKIPANLPGQFSLFGQIFLHCAAATLEGLVEF